MSKKHYFVFLTALFVVFLDQSAKFLVRKNLQLNQSIPIIKNIFHLTYVTNTGSAFSLLQGFNLFFVLFSFAVIAAIFYYLKKIKENGKWIQFAVGLLLGGTIGNLIDRLSLGFVVDFIDFRIWPVFNIADSAVTISVILLIILLWKK
ncbi:signal peptidase II [Candidatus Woesearchaeota archaeon]|nr:signal peptidase II [Candidatus Woesearchaeota archaeon]